jgi:membrane protease YdiL (CAAX protease family)
MFLGALFGYLYLWSGSILVPMLAHFTNNGVAVLLAYLRGRQLSTIDENDLLTMPTYYYVISAVATAAVLYSLYWQRTTYNLPIYAKQNNL